LLVSEIMENDIKGAHSFWNETFWLRLVGAELYHVGVVFITLGVSTVKFGWPWTVLKRAALSVVSPKPWAFGTVLLVCQGLYLLSAFLILKTHRRTPLWFGTEPQKAIDKVIRAARLLSHPILGWKQFKFTLLFFLSTLLSGSIFVRSYLHFRESKNAGALLHCSP
jgi:hypothetical protein